MSVNEFLIDGSDVTVIRFEVSCDECEEPATHAIRLDLRAAGETIYVGKYCEECAQERADRIRGGLPPIPPPPPSVEL